MSSKKFWAALVLALVPLAAGAQEAENEATEPQAPRQRLRVLEHPRDIASFYRSGGSYQPGYFGYHAPYDFSQRYKIAAMYRQGSEWVNPNGYGQYYASVPGPRREVFVVGAPGYRPGWRYRARREDLFLMAPTFLAPVGPLVDDGR